MKKNLLILLWCIFCFELGAKTNYVSLSGKHIYPFDTLENAATNFQTAVDAAFSNDVVLVDDGYYYLSSQVFITNNLVVKSINGSKKTIVDGGFLCYTNRCFRLEQHSLLDGFTVINGAISNKFYNGYLFVHQNWGGGIYASYSTVQNCIISNNIAFSPEGKGGGIYCTHSVVSNCIVTDNKVIDYCSCGGGIYLDDDSLAENCLVKNNTSDIRGGGIYNLSCRIKKCSICNNVSYRGGGVYLRGGTMVNCFVTNNISVDEGGGVLLRTGTMQNILLCDNYSSNFAGGVSVDCGSVINCTICKNRSKTGIDGLYSYYPRDCFIYNTIIYAHIGEGLWFRTGFENKANRIKILSEQTKNCLFGKPPGFLDIVNNDFRLSRKSPCINRGTTKFGPPFPEFDLAGEPRVLDGKIDIGAYECNRYSFINYKINWKKSSKDKILLKYMFNNLKITSENLSIKICDSFIVSNLQPVKVRQKVAVYKSDFPKCIAKLKTKKNGIIAKIKCFNLNNLDKIIDISNMTTKVDWKYISAEYHIGTNVFTDNLYTKYHAIENNFCKGQNP